jgi:putative heme-binding domain-containing protein
MFTCEPVSNLVQHMVVEESGTSFTIERAVDEKDFDFLVSEDPWFRPVMVRTGPDGALWIVDMYRYMIEHPDWLPPQGKAELMKYFRDGAERGRIYRIYPKDRNNKQQDLSNGWVRDSMQQNLVWTQNRAVQAAGALTLLSPDPQSRLHTLCTLDGLNALGPQVLLTALRDPHPAVRRHAVRLSESFTDPEVINAAVKLADDPDAKVRLQLACSLGEWHGPAAAAALAKLAISAGDDVYIRGAVASSLLKHHQAVASELMKWPHFPGSWIYRDVLSVAIALNNRELLASLLHPLELLSDGGYSTAQMQTLAHWHEALAQRSSSLQKLKAAKKDLLSDRLVLFDPIYAWAAKIAAGPQHPADRRALAANLLGWRAERLDADVDILAALLTPQTPAEVQSAAIKALGRTAHAKAATIALTNWPSHSPALRGAITDLLIAREPWAIELLTAIQAGKVAALDLDVARRERLSKHSSPKVKELARKLLAAAETNRQEVVEANRSVLSLKGDRARGAKIFALHCATCHRMDNVGTDIGPALVSVTNWSGEALLTAILDPDRAVEPRFISYTAKTTDDQEAFGIITNESGGSITLRGLDGKEQTLLRTNLKSLTSTNHSLMPMGFESAMNAQEMADLITFLQSPAAR